MKKLSVKTLLVVLTLIVIAMIMATGVQATSSPLNLDLPGLTTTNTTQNPPTTTNTTTNTTTTNTTTNTTARVNTVTNLVGGNNQNLPQTGDASDYAIFLFIAVCVVVAIYAYKKYRNYNI